MDNYSIRIKVPEGRVREILDRLTAAQETISECYEELRNLGVVVVEEKTDSGN